MDSQNAQNLASPEAKKPPQTVDGTGNIWYNPLRADKNALSERIINE